MATRYTTRFIEDDLGIDCEAVSRYSPLDKGGSSPGVPPPKLRTCVDEVHVYLNNDVSDSDSDSASSSVKRSLKDTLHHYRLTKYDLNEQVPHSVLIKLSERIADWESIAVWLKVTKSDRATIRNKYVSQEATKALYALERWSEKLGNGATYYNLVVAFIRAENQELVDVVCESLSKKKGKLKRGQGRIRAENQLDLGIDYVAVSGHTCTLQRPGVDEVFVYTNNDVSDSDSDSASSSVKRSLKDTLHHYRLTKYNLNEQVPHSVLIKLSKRIADWESIAVWLKVTKSDRATIRNQYMSQEATKALYALERWSEKLGNGATYYNLVVAFIRAENQELVDVVCESLSKKKGKLKRGGNTNSTKCDEQLIPSPYGSTCTSEVYKPTGTYMKGFLKVTAILFMIGLFEMCAILFFYYNYKYIPTLKGEALLGNSDTVLVLEYDPHITESITFTIENPQNTTYIYNSTCEHFHRFVDQKSEINLTRDENVYPLPSLYLLNGTTFEYAFNINIGFLNIAVDADTYNLFSPRECRGVAVNIFDDYLHYINFLSDHTSIRPLDTQCFHRLGTQNYTLTATTTGYYFPVLQVSSDYIQFTQIQSIAYRIEGNLHQYDLSGERIACVFQPQFRSSCTVYLTNTPPHSHKLCIIAKTFGNDFLEISYESNINTHIIVLITLTSTLCIILAFIIALMIILWYTHGKCILLPFSTMYVS